VREDLGGIKFCNAFRVNGFLAGNEDASFRDIVVCDGKDGIIVLRRGKFGDEIDCNGLEG
jgi:hypothetical protein